MATAVKHTKGPWTYEPYWEGTGKHILGPNREFVSCHGFAAASGKTPKQAAANGRLMAAAPELLEACRAISKYFPTILPSKGVLPNDVIKQVRAAIAKATTP